MFTKILDAAAITHASAVKEHEAGRKAYKENHLCGWLKHHAVSRFQHGAASLLFVGATVEQAAQALYHTVHAAKQGFRCQEQKDKILQTALPAALAATMAVGSLLGAVVHPVIPRAFSQYNPFLYAVFPLALAQGLKITKG